MSMTSPQTPVLEVTGLSRRYGSTLAVAEVGFTLGAGEIVALLGPNGAGKTTTLRLLTGQLSPSGGTARIGGFDCFAERAQTMALTGYVPDEPVFHDYLTGRELLRFVGGLHGMAEDELARRAQYWVQRLTLDEAIDDYAVNYSRGMKKKLGLALALLHEPRVLILDEPANGLDPFATRTLLEILRERSAQGTAILFSTHLLDQAERICHRAIILLRGRMVAQGRMDALRQQNLAGGSLEEVFFALAAQTEGSGA
jgi:ABC-2 type transport system ATP-binding protein